MRALPAVFDRWIGSRRTEAGFATAGALVVALVGATALLPSTAPPWPTAEARTQAFTETIVETGTVATERMAVYTSSATAGSATLVEIAPEGHIVQAGDVLFRLDSTPFERALLTEQGALRQAEAELTRAVEDARLELFRTRGDLEAATQQIANAERGLANETGGKGQVSVIEAEAALSEATRNLAKARTDVEDLQPLLAERLITAAEFAQATRALTSAEDQARLATARRDSVVGFERPAATSRAEAEVHSARERLIRDGESALSRSAQRRAAIGAGRNKVAEITARIAAQTDQIERATVRARRGGLVVYRDLFFASERRKPQVGDEVFPNQPIVALPDSSQFVVETRIREIDLHKLDRPLVIRVRVDAYPDLRLSATMDQVGALAQEAAGRTGTKFFPLKVRLSSNDPRLRTGMTARVEIDVSAPHESVVVPVQALFEQDGLRYAVVAPGGTPERRPVVVAAETDTIASIASGLAPGDVVLLVDPTASGPPK